VNIKDIKLQGWRGDVLALASGLLLPLAFAPFSIAPLAIVSLLLLFICWHQVTARQAFWRGWLFGLGYFGLGVSWVSVSMIYFGGMTVPLSAVITIVFVMFLALFPATVGLISKRFFKQYQNTPWFVFVLVLPALWVLSEWVRSWIFTGFPWLSVGYSQIAWPLVGYAPVWGVYSISFGVALTAGLLMYALLESAQARKIATGGIVSLWIVGYALTLPEWTEPVDKPISIAMIQGNIEQDKKWLPEQRIPTLDMYANLSRKNWGTDLIIWPETALPMLYHQAKPFLSAVAQEARVNGTELLLGIPVYDGRTKRYFNTMLSIGALESFYEKKHLVPFGEYLPLPSFLGWFIEYFKIPMSNFSSGAGEKPLVQVAGQQVGISICYEDVFGEEVISALPEATLLVNASNDAWFGDSLAPHQHLEIARLRAVETGRYMLRSTNTGVSAVIDPKGRIVSQSPQFENHVLKHEIQPMKGITPYAIFGNLLTVLFMFALIVTAIVLNWRKTRL